MTALDTSICVPALLEWHEAHDACRQAATGALAPAHVLVETYSVLTRLPPPHRVDHDVARRLLSGRFPASAVLVAPVELQARVVEMLSDAGVAGGASYDGLVGLTAAHHHETLLTRDHRAVPTYDRLAVEHQLL